MTLKSCASLRRGAVVLVLLALLPVLALTIYSHFDQRHRVVHQVQQGALAAAKNLQLEVQPLPRPKGIGP